MTPPVVELQGVSLTYRRRRADPITALQEVDLELGAGERLAVVGRSGAGKSSMARLLLGMERPSAGRVRVLGHDLAQVGRRDLRMLRRRMHLVFQDPYDSLHPGLTVEGAVGEPLAIRGRRRAARRAAVLTALDGVGLPTPEAFLGRHPASLSGGQRQRVAMARAIVAAPELVVADEPASMLDASLRTTVIDLLLQLQHQHGTALVFITHDLAVARHVADAVVVLAGGRVAEHAPMERLLLAPEHPESRRLVAAARLAHGVAPLPAAPTGGRDDATS